MDFTFQGASLLGQELQASHITSSYTHITPKCIRACMQFPERQCQAPH